MFYPQATGLIEQNYKLSSRELQAILPLNVGERFLFLLLIDSRCHREERTTISVFLESLFSMGRIL